MSAYSKNKKTRKEKEGRIKDKKKIIAEWSFISAFVIGIITILGLGVKSVKDAISEKEAEENSPKAKIENIEQQNSSSDAAEITDDENTAQPGLKKQWAMKLSEETEKKIQEISLMQTNLASQGIGVSQKDKEMNEFIFVKLGYLIFQLKDLKQACQGDYLKIFRNADIADALNDLENVTGNIIFMIHTDAPLPPAERMESIMPLPVAEYLGVLENFGGLPKMRRQYNPAPKGQTL